MTAPGYSRMPSQVNVLQVVSIQSVDTVNMTAQGLTRQNTYVSIDLRYHVGSVHVIPNQYDQWILRWFGRGWILDTQLPFNTTSLLTNPEPGLTQVGSTGVVQGPLHLNGSTINANGPLILFAVATADLPDPTDLPDGALAFDTTLGYLVVVDAGAWTPVTGGGSSSLGGLFNQTPSGSIDGANTVFTTSHHFVPVSTRLYLNSLREVLGSAYTETAPNIITFITPPDPGDVVTIDYAVAP